jgi:hypothetical protein
MVTTAVQDAAASIDMQDDGFIEKVYAVLDISSSVLDGEGARAELSFGSSSVFTTNDARMVIASMRNTMNLVTAAAIAQGSMRYAFDYGDGLPFFGGERIYLHTGNVGGGLMTFLNVLLIVNFKGGPVNRRR